MPLWQRRHPSVKQGIHARLGFVRIEINLTDRQSRRPAGIGRPAVAGNVAAHHDKDLDTSKIKAMRATVNLGSLCPPACCVLLDLRSRMLTILAGPVSSLLLLYDTHLLPTNQHHYAAISYNPFELQDRQMQNAKNCRRWNDSMEDELRGLVTVVCNARQLLRKSYIAIEHRSSSAAS